MSTVTDISKARRARQRAQAPTTNDLPDRVSDMEAEIWLKEGDVDWLRLQGSRPEASPEVQGKILLDAAWVAAMRDDEKSDKRAQPVLWYTLDGLGRARFIVAPDAFTGTGIREAYWLLRGWWRATRFWWRYAWRMARGRG